MKKPEDKKTLKICFRVSPNEKAMIDKYIAEKDIKMSKWLLSIALNEVKKG